jgi:septum site-determining protein MinC
LNVVVVGGGASGLVAAITARRLGADVTIVEKNPRLGKKILVTGNGRCNLTNINTSSACYHGDPELAAGILSQYDVKSSSVQTVQHEKSDTLMISRTIRSGQSLSHPGSIVLIGDVNPGGEVFAKGNVIVWGTLAGLVHAGNCGDEKAFIIALQLIPTQLRIAHHIACAPEQAPDTPRRVEIAYLQKNRIVIEDYNNTKNMLANLS